MKLKNLFLNPAPRMSPDELKRFREEHREGEYILLDVRQPKEYEKDHLAGATFIPLPQLPGRLDELDRGKPVIAYCAAGPRSRAAAQLLQGQGFREAYVLDGGMKAWDGLTAQGPVQWGLEILEPGEGPAQVLASAFSLERGLQACYRALAAGEDDVRLSELYQRLAGFEDRHMQRLRQAWEKLNPAQRQGVDLDSAETAPRMEGGWQVEEFVARHQGAAQERNQAVMQAMALETQALDLYLRLAQRMEQVDSRELLHDLGEEEKSHLQALGEMLDRLTAE